MGENFTQTFPVYFTSVTQLLWINCLTGNDCILHILWTKGRPKNSFENTWFKVNSLFLEKPQVDILTYSVIDTLCSCIIIMQQKAHWCGCTASFTWSSLPDCKLRIVWVTELSLLSVVVTSTMFFSLDLALAPRQACRQTQ